MYRLPDVTKDYPKGRAVVHALRGVNVVIADGDWLAIQGPTGHGKSTLLQILGALDPPTSGTVELAGQDLTGLRESQLPATRPVARRPPLRGRGAGRRGGPAARRWWCLSSRDPIFSRQPFTFR